MQTITTVIFDLGSVLVNVSPDGEKFSGLMRSMGIEPSNAFRTYWYSNELRQFMTGEIKPQEFYQIAKDRFDLAHSYEEFVEGWCDLFSPVQGMQEVFELVGAQYKLGVLSDTDPLHWERISTDYPWIAKAAPSLSHDIGFLKPHPGMFETAAKNCGSSKHNCLFIDDKQDNVDGARYHGMPALLFQGPEKLIKDLTGLGLLQS